MYAFLQMADFVMDGADVDLLAFPESVAVDRTRFRYQWIDRGRSLISGGVNS